MSKCASCQHYTGDTNYEWWCLMSKNNGVLEPRESVARKIQGNPCWRWRPLGFSDNDEIRENMENVIDRLDSYEKREEEKIK